MNDATSENNVKLDLNHIELDSVLANINGNSNSVSGKITKTSDVSKNQKLLQNNSFEFGTPLQTYNRFDGFHKIDNVSEKKQVAVLVKDEITNFKKNDPPNTIKKTNSTKSRSRKKNRSLNLTLNNLVSSKVTQLRPCLKSKKGKAKKNSKSNRSKVSSNLGANSFATYPECQEKYYISKLSLNNIKNKLL